MHQGKTQTNKNNLQQRLCDKNKRIQRQRCKITGRNSPNGPLKPARAVTYCRGGPMRSPCRAQTTGMIWRNSSTGKHRDPSPPRSTAGSWQPRRRAHRSAAAAAAAAGRSSRLPRQQLQHHRTVHSPPVLSCLSICDTTRSDRRLPAAGGVATQRLERWGCGSVLGGRPRCIIHEEASAPLARAANSLA